MSIVHMGMVSLVLEHPLFWNSKAYMCVCLWRAREIMTTELKSDLLPAPPQTHTHRHPHTHTHTHTAICSQGKDRAKPAGMPRQWGVSGPRVEEGACVCVCVCVCVCWGA